ncbi:MAG: FAD-dependent oxidoreductase, partial [Rhodospirillaceae bacterium]
VMGSEGYLQSQFLAPRTNQRDDAWGGSFENRTRLALEVVRRTRAAVGGGFVILFRLSVLDLVAGGLDDEEIVALARAVEAAGADALNSGIGWHEAPIPTIAQAVPRGAFAGDTAKLKGRVGIPVIASNRINTPDVAERVLAEGQADMVSLARPFLADPAFIDKAAVGRADAINTCIACNQACLDRYFVGRVCSCLVNPRACHETEMTVEPAARARRVAVCGGGVAGMAAALTAAERGHAVTLFEAGPRLGGQFNLARNVPGKYEFDETLRYFRIRLADCGVTIRLEAPADPAAIVDGGFEAAVVATGITPRRPAIPGIDDDRVVGYAAILDGSVRAGRRVAIIGGGGIAFDVALFLLEAGDPAFTDAAAFRARWGIGQATAEPTPRHEITMLQRSPGPMGRGLGKTTGWIHRAVLKHNRVRQISGAAYARIDADGVHVTVDGAPQCVAADTVVVCAGQEPRDDLSAALADAGVEVHAVGGAKAAGELDAERAIREGMEAAVRL